MNKFQSKRRAYKPLKNSAFDVVKSTSRKEDLVDVNIFTK